MKSLSLPPAVGILLNEVSTRANELQFNCFTCPVVLLTARLTVAVLPFPSTTASCLSKTKIYVQYCFLFYNLRLTISDVVFFLDIGLDYCTKPGRLWAQLWAALLLHIALLLTHSYMTTRKPAQRRRQRNRAGARCARNFMVARCSNPVFFGILAILVGIW